MRNTMFINKIIIFSKKRVKMSYALFSAAAIITNVQLIVTTVAKFTTATNTYKTKNPMKQLQL